MNWQPIETAPKAPILGFLRYHAEEIFYSGMEWRYVRDGSIVPDNMQPTHWMPLPEPPKV